MKSSQLIDAIVDLDENKIVEVIKNRLERGEQAIEILKEAGAGMEIIGKKYEREEFSLSELMVASEFFKEGMRILEPYLPVLEKGRQGSVVIGTPQGDIHDIGKNIVATMLKANGFEVHDLGVDAAPEVFVDKVYEIKPQIVAMSSLLTTTYHSMKKVVETLRVFRNDNRLKVLIGGAAVDERVRNYVGADYYGENVLEAVKYAKKIVEELD